MGFQNRYAIDVETPAVYKFAVQGSVGSDSLSLPYDFGGYDDFESVGSERLIPFKEKPQTNVIGAETQHFDILQRRPNGKYGIVGHRTAQVIHIQPVTVALRMLLLIRREAAGGPDTATRAKIEDAYNSFKPGQDDPYRYMMDKMSEIGVAEDQFTVIVAATLTKNGPSRIDDSQVRAVQNGIQGEIGAGPASGQSLNEHLSGMGYEVRRVAPTEYGVAVEPAKFDGLNQRDETEEDTDIDPRDAIEEIVERKEGFPCDIMREKADEKIATVFQYPEFKLEIRWSI